MSTKEELQSRNEELIKTNQRLNEQLKSLIHKNDELTQSLMELEKASKKKREDGDDTFKVKGITVLFIEVQGHKDIVEEEGTESMYDKLDEIFLKFNDIATKHKADRVKVLGDYYVCAGGIAERNTTNPIDVALVAVEINDYLHTIYREYQEKGKAFWNLRIGIHSGNGIVTVKGGKNKSYTLTGEVINTLPRIASMCEPGRSISLTILMS